ncbi:MAG TPA: S8 family serine peptidase [Gaiellales bacterium]|jgi:hypothetical protein|nr:S8 family serine peptidase [Gaiellales bacterium]
MRAALIAALAGAALLFVPGAPAATPMQAVIVHIAPSAWPALGARGAGAIARLERDRRNAQAPALAVLNALQRAGHVRHVRSLWIAGAIALTADAGALAALRSRPDVRSIEPDSELPIRPADSVTGEPGIAATGAPGLWSEGMDGRGITVATLDTGVDLTHPELASRYRGGSNSWFDPFGQHSAPADLDGHGTQVMGVMVAGGGIGMAPGARFIAARVFNDANLSTDSAVHEAFQWLLDPDRDPATNDAPQVVNASWGAQLVACDREFEPDLQALRTAHILPVFAAGNDGPGAGSDTSPANLPEAFAVGATAGASAIAPFSSIGPSRCEGGQFPALVAPGTGIRTTDRFGFYAAGKTGTSFSAPHVAGALALLLQVAPQLTADQQASLLMQSAGDLGAPGPDATFGAGSLDIVAAARLLSPALDFTPPVLSSAAADGATLHVHAADARSAIAGAEWWADSDPGIGKADPIVPADGSFDSPAEDLDAGLGALQPGSHVIGVRARDSAGNWSAAVELPINVAAPPALPSPAPAATPVEPALSLVTAPSARSRVVRMLRDGFETGLASWPGRVGAVRAIRAAAIAGRRGLRATSAAGAPAYVQRALPAATAGIELEFALRPRAFANGTAWSEIAAITSASGRRLASVEVRHAYLRGAVELRLSSAQGDVLRHSRPQTIRRRQATLVLSLSSDRSALSIDGRERAGLPAHASGAPARSVVLGLGRRGPPASTGYLDLDRLTLRAFTHAS